MIARFGYAKDWDRGRILGPELQLAELGHRVQDEDLSEKQYSRVESDAWNVRIIRVDHGASFLEYCWSIRKDFRLMDRVYYVTETLLLAFLLLLRFENMNHHLSDYETRTLRYQTN
jgi:hypothetical protein